MLNKDYHKQISSIRKINNVLDRNLLTVKDLKQGSFFKYSEAIFEVISISKYTEKSGSFWNEIEAYSIIEDKVIYFEWEEDDYIEASITLKELKMNQLDLSIEEIEEISEKESGSIKYNGNKYEYEDDYGAKWEKGQESYKVYFYDFIRGSEILTVEEWKLAKKQYEYKAYISKEIVPKEIHIISL